MNERPKEKQPPPASLTLEDVYYVLFRHKWLLLGLTGLGALAAVGVFLSIPTTYVSNAKLAIRYVLDTKSLPANSKDTGEVQVPNAGGDNLINSEMEILRSFDLAQQVADNLGASNILAKLGGGTNRLAAAAVIARGVKVEAVPRSMIIDVSFESKDPELAQPVLNGLIESYKKLHAEVHRARGDEDVQKRTDELRTHLMDTEDKLRRLKASVGEKAGVSIASLEDAQKALNDQMFKIRDELLAGEAELAERQAAFKQFGALPSAPTNSVAPEAEVPADDLDQYKGYCGDLGSLRDKEDRYRKELLTDSHPMVVTLRKEIDRVEKLKKALEDKYPKLTGLNLPTTGTSVGADDSAVSAARINALKARTNALTQQLVAVQQSLGELEKAAPDLEQLQLQRELDRTSYLSNLASSEKERAYAAWWDSGRASNIGIPQTPSPPAKAARKSKVMLMAFLGAIFGPIALVFGVELFLDPRIKRRSDVENKLHLPVFLTIPDLNHNGHARLAPKPVTDPPSSADKSELALPAAGSQATLNGLKPYCEALRDRLMFYFHARNMTHKPKLVGVTSSSRASGATTIAAGLAAALSETGDGNVLLVDMNVPGAAAHPFHNGKPGCGLPELLEGGKREEAMVNPNLYVVSASDAPGKAGAFLPKRFSDLLPKFKASDYDFIIFELPPVSQTSASANLAGMLDMTFLVLESEKTHKETAKRAAAMFAEAQANYATVLNKTRNYLPGWLRQEL